MGCVAMSGTDSQVTGWVGWGVFAAIMLLIGGFLDVIYGLQAVIGPNDLLVVGETALFAVDVAAWGWWHLLSGALLIIAGFALLAGATWARVVAIILVALNAVGQLTLLGVQPFWAMVVLTIDVLIIYALTVHGHELKARKQ